MATRVLVQRTEAAFCLSPCREKISFLSPLPSFLAPGGSCWALPVDGKVYCVIQKDACFPVGAYVTGCYWTYVSLRLQSAAREETVNKFLKCLVSAPQLEEEVIKDARVFSLSFGSGV